MAIDLGMVVQQLKIGNSSFGWANTRMTPDTVQKYREAIQSLKTAIESQLENLPPEVAEWYARKYDDGMIDIGNLTDEEIQKILDDEAEEQEQAEADKKRRSVVMDPGFAVQVQPFSHSQECEEGRIP